MKMKIQMHKTSKMSSSLLEQKVIFMKEVRNSTSIEGETSSSAIDTGGKFPSIVTISLACSFPLAVQNSP